MKTEFAEGIYFNQPHERAPDFVLGTISIRPQAFIAWLEQQTENDKGYVRLKVNVGRESGKPYVALDDWKPENRTEPQPDDFDESIPF